MNKRPGIIVGIGRRIRWVGIGTALVAASFGWAGAFGCKKSAPPAPPDFKAVRNEAELRRLVQKGSDLSKQLRCLPCHSSEGTTRIGSSYRDIFGQEVKLIDGQVVKRDETYLYEAIVNPGRQRIAGASATMPAYRNLDDEELLSLISYIKSQTAGTPEWEAVHESTDE